MSKRAIIAMVIPTITLLRVNGHWSVLKTLPQMQPKSRTCPTSGVPVIHVRHEFTMPQALFFVPIPREQKSTRLLHHCKQNPLL